MTKTKQAYNTKARKNRNHIYFICAISLQVLLTPTILVNIFEILKFDIENQKVVLDVFENFKIITQNENTLTIYFWGNIILTLIWIIFIYFRPVPSLEYSDEYGSARWTTEEEQKEIFAIEPTDEIDRGGFLIGMNNVIYEKKNGKETYNVKNSKPMFDKDDTHVTVYGTTGSGKTTREIYPTLYFNAISKEKPSFIITDPKGEIFDDTSGFLKKNGYEIRVINLTNPLKGSRYNPMYLINKYMDVYLDNKTNEIGIEAHSNLAKYAQSLAHTIVHQKKRTDEPIWQNGEESLLTGLILYVSEFAPQNERNLSSVYSLLVELGKPDAKGNSELGELMKLLDGNNLAKKYFGASDIAGDKTKGSIFVTTITDLILFADPSIQQLTYMSDHELDEIGKKSTAIYLVVPDQDTTRHFLASLYIDQTYSALVELANTSPNRKLPKKLLVLFDEFGNMPPIKDFNIKIAVARSRGIRFMLILQSADQLTDKYGKETANIILDNCQIQMMIGISSEETAKMFSSKMGGYTIQVGSGGTSGGVDNASVSNNISLAKRELMTSDEVLNLQKPKAIVLKTFSYPSLTDLPPYFVIEYMKKALNECQAPQFNSAFQNVGVFIPVLYLVKKQMAYEEELDKAVVGCAEINISQPLKESLVELKTELEKYIRHIHSLKKEERSKYEKIVDEKMIKVRTHFLKERSLSEDINKKIGDITQFKNKLIDLEQDIFISKACELETRAKNFKSQIISEELESLLSDWKEELADLITEFENEMRMDEEIIHDRATGENFAENEDNFNDFDNVKEQPVNANTQVRLQKIKTKGEE